MHTQSWAGCASRCSACGCPTEHLRTAPADPRVWGANALGEYVCCAASAAAALGIVLLEAVFAVAVVDAPLLFAGQHLVR